MVYFLDYWGLWVVHLNSAVKYETQQYPTSSLPYPYATILVVYLHDHHNISSAYCHVGQSSSSSSSSAEESPVVLCVIVLIRKTTCLLLFVEHLLLLVITCRRYRHQGNTFTSQAHHGTCPRHPIVPIGTIVG